MRMFWEKNKKLLFSVLILMSIWCGGLLGLTKVGSFFMKENPLYHGPISLANFDGVHYLNIAKYGYSFHQQAFFPLFPLVISLFTFLTHHYIYSSIIIVYLSLFASLFLFYKLTLLDFNQRSALWTLLFFLLFPTSFFLGAVYSESLCMVFILGSFYAARKKQWIIAGILGGLASATRLVGIFMLPALLVEWVIQHKNLNKQEMFKKFIKVIFSFLLIPIGLISYMVYQWKYYGDALLFIHSQPDFGANRTGGELVFLPQVIFRYIKIFFSISPREYVFWIALLEFSIFFLSLFIIFYFRKKIRLSYLLFSILVIVTPSLTGTFSSEPRYALVSFPLFMILGDLKNEKVKTVLLLVSTILFAILTIYFTQGYFVA